MKPVYLITGNEFLVEDALDRVRAETGADPLSEVAFDPSVPPPEIATALGTPSLLGGRRLVILRDADGAGKDHIALLERYIESPSPDMVLVLVAEGRTKLDAAVKRAGAIVSLEAPRGRRLVTWIKGRASTHGLKIDDRGCWMLVEAVGSELRDLDGALSQLLTTHGPGSRITAGEVKKAFPRHADERLYIFTDAVGERRLPVAMTALRRILDQGDEPLVVFGALSAHIRRLLRAQAVLDAGPSAVGEALGMPSWRAERMAKQARSYSGDELARALGLLAETDVEMKGGDIPPEAALEKVVVRIVDRV